MKVTVDAGKCVAAGQCVLLAPQVFDQREDDGVVVLLASEPAAELHHAVHDAETLCPAAAIHVTQQ